MNRTSKSFAALLSFAAAIAACDKEIPVDDPLQNPGVLGPRGIIRGAVTYVGPPPCIRDGEIEGTVILLVFDAANPPPPDGLASTALNFATIPGEALFAKYPRPADGPGSKAQPGTSLCPSVDAPAVTASASYAIAQLPAGRFQVRSFYSRQTRFNPLFNFANLPLAGDVAGGALADIRSGERRFATIQVGLEQDGKLQIPPSGFVADGVAVVLGLTLRTTRPYFHVEYGRSVAYDVAPGTATAKDYGSDYGTQRTVIEGDAVAALGAITLPQDHASTSEPGGGDNLFFTAQRSFPQIRFKYGFPGSKDDPATTPADAWLAKRAVPSNPFGDGRARPFYNLDPLEFAAEIPTSGGFVLTRNVTPDGQPEILRDNERLEDIGKIADLFPSVVLSKLLDDGEGNVILPPRAQTDPIVVIQTITLRNRGGGDGPGLMIATSETGDLGDASEALAKPNGTELVTGFTAMVRPSVVCIDPQVALQGTLVTPLETDPNPNNVGSQLVSRERVLKYRANRVKDVAFGCLPPGVYSINVVYPTGQAWSFPNLSGHCSATTSGVPNEDCLVPFADLPSHANGGVPQTVLQAQYGPFDPLKGFPARPLLRSQMLFQTNPDGTPKTFTDESGTHLLPQTVIVKPSPRCGSWQLETETTCSADAECPHPFAGACAAGPDGKRSCDLNADGRINTVKVWVNNTVNEDTNANGILDPGEPDQGRPGQLDLKVPYVCALSHARLLSLPAEKQKE